MVSFLFILSIFWGLTSFITIAFLRWNVKYNRKGLPPGTMGWPVYGETIEFLKQGPVFMTNKRLRYGSFFKSNLLGSPTIISIDPELNRYILVSEAKGLIPGYPQSMLEMLGKFNIAAVHGSAHKHLRGALLALVNPTVIKDQILPNIDSFMRSHLDKWDGKIVDIQQKTKEMAFLSFLSKIANEEASLLGYKFMPEFFKLVLGTLSLPINLPNTNYRRAFQARRNITCWLRKLLEERKASHENKHHDMLGLLLDSDSNFKLRDEEMIDLIITILYSGFETVSTTSMMAIKYLQDHPKALAELKREHKAIRDRKNPEDPIDYNDYKSMSFTQAVIYETSRLATIVNGVLRKTTKDMEINGYMIPKGWRIYVYTREVNYDPSLYPDPYTFNPWRWLGNGLEKHQNFLIFGGGTRHCPGKEVGMVEICVFLHYFVTRYEWEVVGEGKLVHFPRVEAPNGLHIRISAASVDVP